MPETPGAPQDYDVRGSVTAGVPAPRFSIAIAPVVPDPEIPPVVQDASAIFAAFLQADEHLLNPGSITAPVNYQLVQRGTQFERALLCSRLLAALIREDEDILPEIVRMALLAAAGR